jgi:hypothetical protein
MWHYASWYNVNIFSKYLQTFRKRSVTSGSLKICMNQNKENVLLTCVVWRFCSLLWPHSRFLFCPSAPQWPIASSFTRFLDLTQRRTTVGRTPLNEWSARRRDFYLTTHNTHNRQTSIPPLGFEPTIPASKRPHTYALDRAASGTSLFDINIHDNISHFRHPYRCV